MLISQLNLDEVLSESSMIDRLTQINSEDIKLYHFDKCLLQMTRGFFRIQDSGFRIQNECLSIMDNG